MFKLSIVARILIRLSAQFIVLLISISIFMVLVFMRSMRFDHNVYQQSFHISGLLGT